jgi:hypothetical protein
LEHLEAIETIGTNSWRGAVPAVPIVQNVPDV